MTESHPTMPDLRGEPCYCSRPDLPHVHTIGDHKPTDRAARNARRGAK